MYDCKIRQHPSELLTNGWAGHSTDVEENSWTMRRYCVNRASRRLLPRRQPIEEGPRTFLDVCRRAIFPPFPITSIKTSNLNSDIRAVHFRVAATGLRVVSVEGSDEVRAAALVLPPGSGNARQ